jgi:hypothetical protein
MTTKHPIDRLIEAKETKIAHAERTIGKLKIEVAALREAREAVAESVGAARRPNGDAGETVGDTELMRLARSLAWREEDKAEPLPDGRKKGRSISAQWKQVLTDIAQKKSDGADLDEIEQFCRQRGIDLKRPTLRAQMSNYVKRTYLGRTGEGKFFIALNGLIVAGLMSGPNANTTVSGEGREEDRDPAQTGPRGVWK